MTMEIFPHCHYMSEEKILTFAALGDIIIKKLPTEAENELLDTIEG